MHSLIKTNTPIKIINPANSKVIETKIYKKANYPKIFTIVVSEKIASILELDLDNPFVEVVEVKKNKTFIAKKTNMFEEEKKVAEILPVNEVKMDDLTKVEVKAKKKLNKDRKSTRLNSSHALISYAVFCLKKTKEFTAYLNYNYF